MALSLEMSFVFMLKVFIRRESSVQGPLNPLQIKDIVISKYREVSASLCHAGYPVINQHPNQGE